MLNRVLQIIAEAGWFDTTRPFETSVNLTQGACAWLLLTRGGRSDAYVKFSEHLDLEAEAQRCEAASRCYPALAPRFVGWRREADLALLVCGAVDYIGVNAHRLRQPSARARLLGVLAPYFAAMPAAALPAALTPLPNAALLPALAGYFAAHPARALAESWLGSAAAGRVAALRDQPQHGDFVLNNLGHGPTGAAVIFDWEDFGAACLPGLDLFTLELSLADGAAALRRGRIDAGSPVQRFCSAACEAIGLSHAEYLALTPIYALVFRYLKRNYGPGVRERMDRLLEELAVG